MVESRIDGAKAGDRGEICLIQATVKLGGVRRLSSLQLRLILGWGRLPLLTSGTSLPATPPCRPHASTRFSSPPLTTLPAFQPIALIPALNHGSSISCGPPTR